MSPPDTSPAQEFAQLLRQTTDIRRLCKQQRRDLAVQFDRLQAIRRGIRFVEKSLEESQNELWESRLLLELHSGGLTRPRSRRAR